ncbi:MAG: hypothetical protein ACP5LA_07095, partial [Thermoplasmata archaeon]
MIDEELDIIIDEWWNQNLKLRIMTDIDGADEKDFIIDLRLLEEEYENINRSWKDLYEFYKKEKNEEGIIDVFDKKNRAEAGYRLINAFYDCPEKTLEKLNERLHKEVEW